MRPTELLLTRKLLNRDVEAGRAHGNGNGFDGKPHGGLVTNLIPIIPTLSINKYL
jgi:hypothetical protein